MKLADKGVRRTHVHIYTTSFLAIEDVGAAGFTESKFGVFIGLQSIKAAGSSSVATWGYHQIRLSGHVWSYRDLLRTGGVCGGSSKLRV